MRLAMLIELWESRTPLCLLSYIAGNHVWSRGCLASSSSSRPWMRTIRLMQFAQRPVRYHAVMVRTGGESRCFIRQLQDPFLGSSKRYFSSVRGNRKNGSMNHTDIIQNHVDGVPT